MAWNEGRFGSWGSSQIIAAIMRAEIKVMSIRKATGETFKTTNHQILANKFTVRFLTVWFARVFSFFLPPPPSEVKFSLPFGSFGTSAQKLHLNLKLSTLIFQKGTEVLSVIFVLV